MTPHLVQPAKPGQRLRDPSNAMVAGNEIDRFLFGKQEVSATANAPRLAQGHILDLAQGGARVAR